MNVQTANRLVELRKNAGYSQEELADAIGVSRQAVSKWERAESSPDTDNLIELARLYNVSLDELINGDELPKRNEAKQPEAEKPSDGFVFEQDGATVEIKSDTILVKNEEGEEKSYDAAQYKRKRAKEKRISVLVGSLSALLATIIYLVLGFTVSGGWYYAWPIFLLIPVFGSVVVCVFYKRVTAFCYPPLVVAVYCLVGVLQGLWHPTWIIFLTIPVFYIIAGRIDSVTRAKDYEVMENAMAKKEGQPFHKGRN